MNLNLNGKVIVVTGAASGIGQAIARLAAEAGAEALLLADRNEDGCHSLEAELKTSGAKVECHVADLTDVAAPKAVVEAVIRNFGRIDGLVNAAGLTTRGSFVDGTPKIWDELFSVNARAPFFLMQEAIADMLVREAPGVIVNILSINAHCGTPELAIYSGTKGALATLTKNAANAHMADRIRVNGINLGWVATESECTMQANTLGRGEGWLTEEAAKMPLGRLVEAEEAARLSVFLLSDASAPMSGSVVDFEQKVAGAMG